MSIIIGADIGYNRTKIVSKNGTDIFLSTLEEEINEVNSNAITVEFEGKEYTVGSITGNVSTDMNKIDDPIFRLCLWTGIARQMGEETVADIDLVTGLPANYYKSQKDELIESLSGKTINIVLGDQPKRFTIKNCIVFPQSAGLFLLNPKDFENTKNIVIDIGGLTVDVSVFNGLTLVRTNTYNLGMHKLYDKVVQELQAKHSLDYGLLEAEDVIRDKKIIKDNKGTDVTDLINNVCKKHTNLILNTVKNGFKEYNTSIRNFIGGGSYSLRDCLEIAAKKDDIFTNARAFYEVGVRKCNEKV